ncbi:MAG: mechanosensitive ion channel domain-containing protein [Limnoraphis robusta]|uniref:Membrane protein n=1 Tax=Limnoraphis robusta CS-951 TaxID=1637645 RepID=A0A0F5YHT8_9CYAN|nr:mechanosensitive ion channel domain-containing protein [Limnoraphis robusta]KKD38207.1 membrane protein [Limnoraphis robusta CS-951]
MINLPFNSWGVALNPNVNLGIWIGAGILALVGLFALKNIIQNQIIYRFFSSEKLELYKQIFSPYQSLILIVLGLLGAESFLLSVPLSPSLASLEVILSLSLAITASWLASQVFKQFFDIYVVNTAARKKGRSVNSELLLVGKFIANAVIIIIATLTFAQTHKVNIFGLLASLGVGGLAVAFAAQSILSQILGGIVLYLDQPFVVDDYIGLPDGTFGRVESIGLRSTKIRMSGKGSLMIVPNSSLTETNIENFTGARKVISILGLLFHRTITPEEKALIRQVILEGTDNTYGIDPRGTDVTFKDLKEVTGEDKTQAQVTFFILGSGQENLELRRQLLQIASQDINIILQQYGIAFEMEEPNIYVNSPITV